MNDLKTNVALAILLDEATLKILGINSKVYVTKSKSLSDEEFEKFRKLVKELGGKWDKERKMWYIENSFRLKEFEKVSAMIDELSSLGVVFIVNDGKVSLTSDDLLDAIMLAEEKMNYLSKKLFKICFKLERVGREKFRKLVNEGKIMYVKEKSEFCITEHSQPVKEIIDIILENASDGRALLAAKILRNRQLDEERDDIVFLGNFVKVKVNDEELRRFISYAESFEECDIKSPEIEKERRERGFSYCEYKWVNVGGELQLQGVVRRLYRIDKEKGHILTYRGLYRRLIRALGRSIDEAKLFREDIPRETHQKFLRDYQREAVNSSLELLRLQGAATIQAATGAGKTEMAVAIAKELMEKGIVRKVFFLSLNRTLNIQAVMRFRKYGIDAGLVDSENYQIEKPVVACTVQTLYKSMEKTGRIRKTINEKTEEDVIIDYVELGSEKAKKLVEEYLNADLVIVDEVQHVPARTVSEVIQANPNSIRLGLSATPWRDDGRDVMIYALIGDVAERRILSSELISRGYLVPVKIYMWQRKVEADDTIKSELAGLQGAQKYAKLKNFIFYDKKRNKDIAEIAQIAPKPVLVLVKEIKHAHEVAKHVKEESMSVMVLTGRENSVQREAALRRVKEEKLDVLVATTLADEGLDLPPLRTLILAAGGRSQTRTLQRIGRVTRPYPGKEVGIVVDIWDDDRELGGIFYRQGLARYELYRTEPKWYIAKIRSLRELKRKLASESNSLRNLYNTIKEDKS